MSAPPVLYFYGLAGAGKNFVGDIAGQMFHRFVYHADIDLTPEMHTALVARENFTIAMLDRFFTVVARRIGALRADHGALVVTQATYRLRHREYLLQNVPDLEMIQVSARDEIIMERIARRGDIVTPDYAILMRGKFEMPPVHAKIVVNESDANDVVTQLLALYPDAAPRQ